MFPERVRCGRCRCSHRGSPGCWLTVLDNGGVADTARAVARGQLSVGGAWSRLSRSAAAVDALVARLADDQGLAVASDHHLGPFGL
jgi:hypothetical protein